MPDIAFPWNLTGYPASGNLALVQLTSITGIYGLSLIVAAYNALAGVRDWDGCARGAERFRIRGVAAFTALILVWALIGPTMSPRRRLRRSRIWCNRICRVDGVPGQLGCNPRRGMAELEALSIAAGQKDRGLVVWPEVPAPFSLQDAEFARRAQAHRARVAQRFPPRRDRLEALRRRPSGRIQQRGDARSRGPRGISL